MHDVCSSNGISTANGTLSLMLGVSVGSVSVVVDDDSVPISD